jgi:branched-chain amino acid transport system permease protein
MALFLTYALDGIALGCIYDLIALGFSIIYKASQVINFAQGEFLLVGAFITSIAVFSWHLGFLPALALGIIVTVVIGVLFERFVLRRMIGKPIFSIIMITIGLDILLLTGVSTTERSDILPAATPFHGNTLLSVGGVSILAIDLAAMLITLIFCVLLYLFFRYTKYGLAMRSTALDQEAALALGINVRTVYALAWGISAAIAAIGGVFLAAGFGSPAFDISLGQTALFAFPAIILGGLDSVSGAVVGGIVIGLAQQLTAHYENTWAAKLDVAGWHQTAQYLIGLHEIAPFLIMLALLFIRPYGLFGSRKVERV